MKYKNVSSIEDGKKYKNVSSTEDGKRKRERKMQRDWSMDSKYNYKEGRTKGLTTDNNNELHI